jgi:hypothetical protein
MSNYSNLPGVNMTVKDGQLLVSSDKTGNSLLIIAEAKTNRTLPEEPVYISTEEELKANFGGFFYLGELNPIAAEWKAAKEAGVGNIYLLALDGANLKEKFVNLQDKLFNLMADLSISHIVLSGLHADDVIPALVAADFKGVSDINEVAGVEVFNTFTATAAPATLTVTVPVTLTATVAGTEPAVVTIGATKTIGELIPLLNIEMAQALAVVGSDAKITFELISGKVVAKSTEAVTFTGTAVLTALALTAIPAVVKGVGNPAVMLAAYAERQSLEVGNCIAYATTSAPANTSLAAIKAHVDGLVARNNQISKYLQVIAGPQVAITVPGSLRPQWVSGVTQYACLVNGLQPQIAPTNQTLPAAHGLRYNFSLRQLNALVGNKYVTFRTKNNRIIVIDGVTTAPDLYVGDEVMKSDFTRLSTLRITNHMVKAIRESCDAFIGMPNEFPVYNSMNTSIKAVIKDAIDKGIIQDARYSITLGNSLDAATVNMTILPQFELRAIDVTIGLSTPDSF